MIKCYSSKKPFWYKIADRLNSDKAFGNYLNFERFSNSRKNLFRKGFFCTNCCQIFRFY